MPHIIALDTEHNPDFFSIIDRHNAIMDEWNRLNRELHAFNIPRFFPFFRRKKLAIIANSSEELQKQFIAWNKDAYAIIKEPVVIPRQDADPQTTFLHYMSLIRDIRNRLSFDMQLLLDNFNQCKSDLNNQINFVIAVFSFSASFAGLIFAIIAFKPS